MRSWGSKLGLFFLAGVLALSLLGVVWNVATGFSEAQDGTRTFDLQMGWNNFVWTGDSGTDPATALNCIDGKYPIAYRFVGAGQTFERHVPGNEALSNMTSLNQYDNLMVLVTASGVQCQIPLRAPTATRHFDLQMGWNNFVWTGASDAAPQTALICIEGDYAIGYRWMGTTGTWERYVPASPAPPLSNMTSLNQYDPLLVLITTTGVQCEDMPVDTPSTTPTSSPTPTPTPTPSPTATPTPGPVAGARYSGTTSQDKPISFRVSDDGEYIRHLRFEWVCGTSDYEVAVRFGRGAVPIEDLAFPWAVEDRDGGFEAEGEASGISWWVVGFFTLPPTARGFVDTSVRSLFTPDCPIWWVSWTAEAE